MYGRDEQIPLHVPDADGLGDPQPCRRLAEKCVQIGAFDGTLRVRGTLDDAAPDPWPLLYESVGDSVNAVIVAVPYAVRSVRLEREGIVGDKPSAILSGLLIG